MALEDAITLLDLINEGKDNSYNIKDCSLLVSIGSNLLNVGGCVFDKYIDFIKNASTTIRLTDKEIEKYKYNPKKLSKDLYNTEELWFLLLKLNNISTEMDFPKNKMSVLLPENLSMLNQILIINDDEINSNHIEMDYE